jgi:ribosomal-protein-alanine N-acetyltransferase
MNGDPRVMRWFPQPLTTYESHALVDRLTEHHDRHGYTAWAVEVQDSVNGPAPFVGFVGLTQPRHSMPFDHEAPLVEVGWRLDPKWWGLGIATEAAGAALAFAFGELKLEEVVSFTVPANIESQAVMQRLGMSYAGTFNHPAGGLAWWAPHVLYRARRHLFDGLGDFAADSGSTMLPSRQRNLDGRVNRGFRQVDLSDAAIPAQEPRSGPNVERRR